MMVSRRSANPGATKPALRPDAFQATRCASSTATDQRRRSSSRAAVRPARPAPITHTSTSRSPASAGRCGASTIVAAYQVAPHGVASLGIVVPGGRSKFRRISCAALSLRDPRCRRCANVVPIPCGEIKLPGLREKDGPHAMRRLLLLRHSKSDWTRPGAPDHERTLAPRGREAAPRIGAYMVRHALNPDLVLCSTATRARETWDLVAKAFVQKPPAVFDERLYEASAGALLEVVKETKGSVHALL